MRAQKMKQEEKSSIDMPSTTLHSKRNSIIANTLWRVIYKTSTWLTHANVQREGVHSELSLPDRLEFRLPLSGDNLLRRSDKVYVCQGLFSQQTLF